MWVNVAVAAAEQLFREPGAGAEKKKFVLEFLQSKGYTYESDTVDMMIEAAVRQLKIAQRDVAAPVITNPP